MKIPFLRFKSNIVLLLIRFVGIIALFSSFKIINSIFGEESLGVFSLMIVLIQILSVIVSFGLPIYSMKEISILGKQERVDQKVDKIILDNFNVLFINSLLCMIFVSVSYFVAKEFNFFTLVYPKYIFLPILFSIPFTSLIAFNSQILRAKGKHIYFQWLNSNLLYVFFTLFLGISFLLSVNKKYIFAGYFICVLFTFLFSYKLLPIKYSFQKLNIKKYFFNLSNGIDFFITQFVTQGFNWVTILYTAHLINEIDAGGLNIINKYLSLTGLLIMVVNMKKGPDYTYLFHKGDIEKLNKDISVNTKFMFFLTLPVIVLLFMFPEFFLSVFSEKYIHLAKVFRIMLIGYFVNLYCGSVGMLMQMTNEQKKYRNIMLLALFIHLSLGYVLTKNIGIYGLGISLSISLIFWNLFSVFILKKKYNLISYFTIRKL